MMRSICVFVGASLGKNPAYLEATKQLGAELAKRNLHLVYGGGRLGLMGILADSVIQNGGTVTGVIPQVLHEREAHAGLSNLHIVNSMQERKKMMEELSDCFIALPGGLGTLEELCEFWNAAKIGVHKKPLALLNTENYFDKFLEFMDYSVDETFLKLHHRALIKVSTNPSQLLDDLIS
jgi:uncharacterized protein (TIGR00730 family)